MTAETTTTPDEKVALMRDLIRLRDRKDDLKREEKEVDRDIRQKEAGILEYFERSGISNVSIDGRTLYIHRSQWARGRSDIDPEIVIEALRANGLGDMVKETFSTQTLSSYVRELDREDKSMPPGLAEVIDISEKVTVGVRRK
jgi:hypothetical protein